jgi:cobalt-zinc-cadmium efflux system membrane fusion protein
MSRRYPLIAGAATIALILSGLWWFASRPVETGNSAPASNAQPTDGILAVDARRAAQMGIRLMPATAAADAALATIPAMIEPPANARVAVAATFPGTVLRTLVVEGDSVRRGQPLAIIASRDVLTIGADLSRANARRGVAEANAARLSLLSREGIIAGARADEANAIAAEARADVSEKSRILAMVGGHGAWLRWEVEGSGSGARPRPRIRLDGSRRSSSPSRSRTRAAASISCRVFWVAGSVSTSSVSAVLSARLLTASGRAVVWRT